MGVKQNKARGYAAEREITKRIQASWPDRFYMERTGLSGGHDLSGRYYVGEVKAVRTGPVWLKDGLTQLDNSPDKPGILFVCLSQGPGKKAKWLALMDVGDFEGIINVPA